MLSCGGTLAGLARGGWTVALVTVFAGGAQQAARRAEDLEAARRLGIERVEQLPLTPAARHSDEAAAQVAAVLGPVLDAERPDRILAPRAADQDPDHLTVVDAIAWLAHPAPVVRWRDTPYALTEPLARPLPDERGIPIAKQLDRKLDAVAAYAEHAASASALRAFHEAEGRRLGVDGPAEALTEPPRDPRRSRRTQEDDKAALIRALRSARR